MVMPTAAAESKDQKKYGPHRRADGRPHLAIKGEAVTEEPCSGRLRPERNFGPRSHSPALNRPRHLITRLSEGEPHGSARLQPTSTSAKIVTESHADSTIR